MSEDCNEHEPDGDLAAYVNRSRSRRNTDRIDAALKLIDTQVALFGSTWGPDNPQRGILHEIRQALLGNAPVDEEVQG